jgi:hypothetical protein
MVYNMKKLLPLTLILVFALGFLSGCKKDKGDPPALPPAESMAIDFTNFEAGKKSAEISLPKGVEDINWSLVYGVADFWRTIINTTLAVPVLSFKLAVDQTPSYIDNKTWQWKYTYASVYTVRLTGQNRSTDVLWNMYITKTGSGGFGEFLWFSGTSKLDGKGGQWTLNYSPTDQVPVLEIVWTRTGTTMGTVKYTYVKTKLADKVTTNPFNTSYITYGKTTGSFDAYYTIHYYYSTAFADFNVEWSTTGKNGRVKCLGFYGDTVWHCWDGNYVDITCP